MSNYKTLLGVMLRNGFRGFKATLGNNKKMSTLAISMLFGFLLLIFGGMMVLSGVQFGVLGSSNDIMGQIFAIAITALQIFLLVFAIIYMLNIMYFSRDNEFLLSLPVKNSTIFLAKLTIIYTFLLIISTIFFIFFGISFGVTSHIAASQYGMSGVPVSYYFGLLVSIFIAPIFPLFIATLLSFPFMYIVSYIKKNRYISIIFVFLLIAAFATLYISLFTGMDMSSSGAEGGEGMNGLLLPASAIAVLNNIYKYLFFNAALSDLFIMHQNIGMAILQFVLFNGAFIAISYLLAKILYRRGMAKQLESAREVVKNKAFGVKSPIKTIVHNEIRLLFRTPVLLLYVLLELVLPIVMVVIFSTGMSGLQGEETEIAFMQSINSLFVMLFGMTFACGTNFLAICTISKEGRSFYLMKTIPVPVIKQLEVKGLIAYVVPVVSVLIVSLVTAITGMISVFTAVCIFVFGTVVSYGFTFFQISLDVKHPRLDWENIGQVLQNNINSAKSMGVSFLISIVSVLIMGGGIFLRAVMEPMVVDLLIWGVLLVGAGLVTYMFRKSFLKQTIVNFEKIEE